MKKKRGLIMCSGGLDSVVAAYIVLSWWHEITLLQFRYGCIADDIETATVKAIADKMGVTRVVLDLPGLSDLDVPLMNHKDPGQERIDYAQWWIPCRNLVLTAHAVSYAVEHEFDYVVIGNIAGYLDVAPLHTDNDPEFVRRFNALLEFSAIGDRKVIVIAPLNVLTKAEVVTFGNELNIPMELTWSCFRAGPIHCGTCGSCVGRREAFRLAGVQDKTLYAEQVLAS
jgi:7-cyano-7-deazaguanine synthase